MKLIDAIHLAAEFGYGYRMQAIEIAAETIVDAVFYDQAAREVARLEARSDGVVFPREAARFKADVVGHDARVAASERLADELGALRRLDVAEFNAWIDGMDLSPAMTLS